MPSARSTPDELVQAIKSKLFKALIADFNGGANIGITSMQYDANANKYIKLELVIPEENIYVPPKITKKVLIMAGLENDEWWGNDWTDYI